jgi:hypothetical protein
MYKVIIALMFTLFIISMNNLFFFRFNDYFLKEMFFIKLFVGEENLIV